MKREIISPKFGPVRGVSPIVRGGHDANNAPEAVMNLGLMPNNSLGLPDGPAKLDSAKLLVENQLPSQLSNEIRVNGKTTVTVGVLETFAITNYDMNTTYSIVGGTGLVISTKPNGVFTIKALSAGPKSFTVNGKSYTVTAV